MSAQPAKFLFETEFGGGGEIKRPTSASARDKAEREAREAAEKAEELAAAEARGHAAGLIAGEQSAALREQARLSSAIEQLAASARAILGTLDRLCASVEEEAVRLALETAHRLAAGLIAAEPAHEIERVAREALSHVRRAPHLVLRVNAELVELVEGRMKAIAWEKGYEGRVIVLGEPEIAIGDCRIEWADGGVVRDSAVINAAINEALERYLASRASGTKEQAS